ncbi:MAG: hypothetical protein IH889_03860 [Planctomycetes bacterium]|nr:hypothetical protein [Planctomycetota bacterium]
MLELLVVLTVTLMLTTLLLPTLALLRENVYEVICSSNLHQTGLSTVMYADEHNGWLPHSVYGEPGGNKQEMMAAHTGQDPTGDHWEGLGWLYAQHYSDVPAVFYCPSHTGEHPFERYHALYPQYRYMQAAGSPIYTNYHYAGDVDWETGTRRRLEQGDSLVIATDGLRTVRDFNHRTGLNVLRADGSVLWRDNIFRRLEGYLPLGGIDESDLAFEYTAMWNIIQSHN